MSEAGGLDSNFDRFGSKETPANAVHDLWKDLDDEFGAEGTLALQDFGMTGELGDDVDPEIAKKIEQLVSKFPKADIQEAIGEMEEDQMAA